MALPPLSEYWRGQRKALRQLLWGIGSERSMGPALAQVVRQPLAHHVQQYVLLLLSLGDTIGDVSGRALLPRRVICGGARGGEAPSPLAQDTCRAQEPWFENHLARLWGPGSVLGGLRDTYLPWGG